MREKEAQPNEAERKRCIHVSGVELDMYAVRDPDVVESAEDWEDFQLLDEETEALYAGEFDNV